MAACWALVRVAADLAVAAFTISDSIWALRAVQASRSGSSTTGSTRRMIESRSV